VSKLASALSAVQALLKAYPALSAALVNIAVVACAYFGLHVTGDQIVYLAGIVAALLGVLVHSHVTPVSKQQPDEKKQDVASIQR
jgi:hypothetical protein